MKNYNLSLSDSAWYDVNSQKCSRKIVPQGRLFCHTLCMGGVDGER